MSSHDEEAIRQKVEQFAETWNQHDMSTFASLFTKNSDCVTLGGDWLRGQDEIKKDMVKDHATVFRESQLMINAVGVRFLRPDIAVAHVTWELTGLPGRDFQKLPWAVRGIMTWMLTNDDDTWRIAAFQNTRIEAPPPDLLVE
jgi:uncharacterized protein (TIGR02246 family)